MILKFQESSLTTGFAGQHAAGEPTGHSACKGTDRTTAKQLAKKFYEKRQAYQGTSVIERVDEVGTQPPSSERGKVDLKDPIKRFALNLEASKKEQEGLMRKAEEQLSERCTFQPNTGKEMRQTHSGTI